MSVHVTTEHKTKPQYTDEVIAALSQALPDSLDHDGCEVIQLRRDQDAPTSVVSFTQWASCRIACRAAAFGADGRGATAGNAGGGVAATPGSGATGAPISVARVASNPARTAASNSLGRGPSPNRCSSRRTPSRSPTARRRAQGRSVRQGELRSRPPARPLVDLGTHHGANTIRTSSAVTATADRNFPVRAAEPYLDVSLGARIVAVPLRAVVSYGPDPEPHRQWQEATLLQ